MMLCHWNMGCHAIKKKIIDLGSSQSKAGRVGVGLRHWSVCLGAYTGLEFHRHTEENTSKAKQNKSNLGELCAIHDVATVWRYSSG